MNETLYKTTVTYNIEGVDGSDGLKLTHEIGLPVPFDEAVLLYYVRLQQMLPGEARDFAGYVSGIGDGKSLKEVLLEKLNK